MVGPMVDGQDWCLIKKFGVLIIEVPRSAKAGHDEDDEVVREGAAEVVRPSVRISILRGE